MEASLVTSGSNDYALDEFKALREEVKRCESESLSTTLFVFTALVLATGLYEKNGIPKPLVAVVVQTVLLWGMHRFYALTSLRLRLSTYIKLLLEPRLPGINWETRNARFELAVRPIYYYRNASISWLLHRVSQIFFLFPAIGLFLTVDSLSRMGSKGPSFYGYAAVLAILHIASTLLALKCVFFRPTEEAYSTLWRAISKDEPEPQPTTAASKGAAA
jgi:hypothetical protein